jgi:hypothetical protein
VIRLSRKGTAAVSALPLGDDQGDVVVLFVGREGTDVGGDSKLVRLLLLDFAAAAFLVR